MELSLKLSIETIQSHGLRPERHDAKLLGIFHDTWRQSSHSRSEASVGRVALVLSISEPARRHYKLYHLRTKQTNYFR